MSDSADEDAELVARERAYCLRLLAEIPGDRKRLDEREHEIVMSARHAGISWDQIGEALGTGADHARKRHGEPEPGDTPF